MEESSLPCCKGNTFPHSISLLSVFFVLFFINFVDYFRDPNRSYFMLLISLWFIYSVDFPFILIIDNAFWFWVSYALLRYQGNNFNAFWVSLSGNHTLYIASKTISKCLQLHLCSLTYFMVGVTYFRDLYFLFMSWTFVCFFFHKINPEWQRFCAMQT